MASITIEQIGLLFDQKIGAKLDGFSARIGIIENKVSVGMAEFKDALEAAQVEIAAIKGRLGGIESGSSSDSQGQGSAAKRARSTPTIGSSASADEPDSGSKGNAAPDVCKVRVNTMANTLITKDALTPLVHARMVEANIDPQDGQILGGAFGHSFAVRFKRAEYAKQVLASLRGADGWAQDVVPLPSGTGETVKVFYTMDKTPRQRKIDYAWRKFRGLVQDAAGKLQPPRELQYDPRERLVACEWRSVARLRVLEQERVVINWTPGQQVFSEDEAQRISAALSDVFDKGWG